LDAALDGAAFLFLGEIMAGFGKTVKLTYGYGFGRQVQVSSAGLGELLNPYSGGFGETVHVPLGGFGDLVSLSGCFPKSEPIQTTPFDCAPIGSIKTGDKLASWNTVQNKFQYTAVTNIHEYRVHEIIYLNKTIRVSSCHPMLVAERAESGLITLKWKAAFDVETGDCLLGCDGKIIEIRTKSRRWLSGGVDVINLSTDCGSPFFAGGFIVRAENAADNLAWADTPVTKKLLSA